MCFSMRPQAQLALPVLVLVQAVTPPLLLATHLKRRRLEPWRGVLHACNVVLAVLLARFAIFDILQVCILRQAQINGILSLSDCAPSSSLCRGHWVVNFPNCVGRAAVITGVSIR